MKAPIPCWLCKGEKEVDHYDFAPVNGRLQYVEKLPCPECEGTGDQNCCECGKRPAVHLDPWTDEKGKPHTDELCDVCNEARRESERRAA